MLCCFGDVRFFGAGGGFFLGFVGEFFFAGLGGGKFGLEAVDAAFGVDDFFFAGEEWVRGATDVDFHEWIRVAVFPFDGVVSLRCALCEKRKARLIVAKYDRAIGWGVNTAFHTRIIVAKMLENVKGECYS